MGRKAGAEAQGSIIGAITAGKEILAAMRSHSQDAWPDERKCMGATSALLGALDLLREEPDLVANEQAMAFIHLLIFASALCMGNAMVRTAKGGGKPAHGEAATEAWRRLVDEHARAAWNLITDIEGEGGNLHRMFHWVVALLQIAP